MSGSTPSTVKGLASKRHDLSEGLYCGFVSVVMSSWRGNDMIVDLVAANNVHHGSHE